MVKEMEENICKFYFNKAKLVDNFNAYKSIGNVYYPLKTNSNTSVINVIKSIINKNDGFLISSITHFRILQKENINPLNMCFMNVLAEDETIKYLYENGVRFFTFDNFETVIKFAKYADLSKVKIVIRLSTVEVFKNKYTHLGANVEEIIKILKFLKVRCNNYGISFYIQENLKSEINVLGKMLEFIEKHFNNTGISFINIGGINKSKYIEKEAIEKAKNSLKINQINLEIGRNIVADTIDMETRIIREKMVGDTKTIIIKNGIYSGFFDILLYNKKFSIYLLTKNNKEIKFEHVANMEADYKIFMCGGSSDSGDKIGEMYINHKYIEELKVGAKIIIKDIGAYFEEFFMPYSNDLKRIYIGI